MRVVIQQEKLQRSKLFRHATGVDELMTTATGDALLMIAHAKLRSRKDPIAMKCVIKFQMVLFPETTQLDDIPVMNYMTEQSRHFREIAATQNPLLLILAVNLPWSYNVYPADQLLFHLCSILREHGGYPNAAQLVLTGTPIFANLERKALLNQRKLNYGRIPGKGGTWDGLQGFQWYPRYRTLWSLNAAMIL